MPDSGLGLHRLSWADFDALAGGSCDLRLVRGLRRAERSRRLLLLRALTDEVTKLPELTGPLPSLDIAWELLGRVQHHAPRALDRLLAHPYLGSWAGYTIRLLRKQMDGVCPLWMHVGHLHALAAAAAIRAGIPFETRIPLWQGNSMLPTLGMALLPADSSCATATVRSDGTHVWIGTPAGEVRLPKDRTASTSGWWGIRKLRIGSGATRTTVRLDDIDPYRGLYEPVGPQRLTQNEVAEWRTLLEQAWALLTRLLPGHAKAMTAGFDSLVPRPAVPFGNLSASAGEAFGSAVISLPADAATLAATLVHEFHHILLDGLLHLVELTTDDPRERFYTPWRDDPRPIGGVLQGVFAFFGVTAFWRALANSSDRAGKGHAWFEFAYWRAGTWRTLQAMCEDPELTKAGSRFVAQIAKHLGPWQEEPVPAEFAELAAVAGADDYAGWRIRYLRPSTEMVNQLAHGWLAGRTWPNGLDFGKDPVPTPVPDGAWTKIREQLIRLRLTETRPERFGELLSTVPGFTFADGAFATGRLAEALDEYRVMLTQDPDHAMAWTGLGVTLAAIGTNPVASRALLGHPEVIRGVYRRILTLTGSAPDPDDLATWIGRYAR